MFHPVLACQGNKQELIILRKGFEGYVSLGARDYADHSVRMHLVFTWIALMSGLLWFSTRTSYPSLFQVVLSGISWVLMVNAVGSVVLWFAR
jgi:hypothetical protein